MSSETLGGHISVTVDLPAELHRRVSHLAVQHHQSLSVTLADLATRGLAAMGDPSGSPDD